jgi:diguanylate cyclase (GGDEF)-like protein
MHWPTRRQSEAAVLGGVVVIGAWSLAQPSAAVAALTCTAAAITGGYIAFFHSPRPLVINGAIAIAITTAAVLRLAHEADIQSAVTAFWIIWFLNLSVPMAVAAMSRAIGTYAQRSEQDPLTGLLNRRAFTNAVTDRVVSAPQQHTHLSVLMVDLDNFKRINDTHGHSIGDCTLRAVADLLREHTPAEAAICRAGGEEFLVALTAEHADLRPLADRFCAAVAQLDPAITASIGTASAQLRQLSTTNGVNPVDELIARADSAMYAAKRSGGNQAHHIAVM